MRAISLLRIDDINGLLLLDRFQQFLKFLLRGGNGFFRAGHFEVDRAGRRFNDCAEQPVAGLFHRRLSHRHSAARENSGQVNRGNREAVDGFFGEFGFGVGRTGVRLFELADPAF